MWVNFEILSIAFLVVLVSTEVSSLQTGSFLFPRSVLQQTKREKTVANKAATINPLQEYSSSSSDSTEEQEVQTTPPQSTQSSSSSSSEEEPLPAEKGELGIPEQLMKVRHGVYKGQVAVFVDSQSEEVEKEKPAHFTTTSTVKPKTQLSPKWNKAARKLIKAAMKITTASTTTTISTKRPPTPHSTPKPNIEIIKTQSVRKHPATSNPMSPNSIRKTTPICLHLGASCRRHNECCTHHCNWRTGMKCDYAGW